MRGAGAKPEQAGYKQLTHDTDLTLRGSATGETADHRCGSPGEIQAWMEPLHPHTDNPLHRYIRRRQATITKMRTHATGKLRVGYLYL